jgi:hypothetical protein
VEVEKELFRIGSRLRLSRFLYQAARVSRDVEAIEKTTETGNPKYVTRRAQNKVLGRALGRLGFWRRIWGLGRAGGIDDGPASFQ